MPLSQNRASEIKFEEPLSSIGAPELKTVLLSLDGAPEYCHNHKKPPQIENTPEVCTAGSRVNNMFPHIVKKEFQKSIEKQNFKLKANFVFVFVDDDVFVGR